MWFLIFAYTITHSCIKRARLERGIYQNAGPWTGKIHARGAVRGIERGRGLDGGRGGG